MKKHYQAKIFVSRKGQHFTGKKKQNKIYKFHKQKT